MRIQPAKRIRGRLTMPGDKSISHRAAMIAALAHGVSRIDNYAASSDCAATLSCLRQVGVRIEEAGHELTIRGVGMDGLRAPGGPLDCGNSGTTMRLLAGILAGQNFASILTGDQSLRSRPMQRIIEPLEMMGAKISSPAGSAPLEIRGRRPLAPITYELLVSSAQVKSSILLAGLNAKGRTKVIENEPTRDHTERMLKWFGVPIETGHADREGENAAFAAVAGPAHFSARDVFIPGDVSSAAYFIVAAALLPESSLEISDVGVNPTRVLLLNKLAALGFNISVDDVREECNEPRGRVCIQGLGSIPARPGSQLPVKIDGLAVPQLIDELPLLAVVGSQIPGGIEIRDATELRVKESDRIATTVQNLRAMGVDVEELEDGMLVSGPTRLQGTKINPHGDHRIAMAFTVAALLADGESEIEDANCVAVSFPEFFDSMNLVIER